MTTSKNQPEAEPELISLTEAFDTVMLSYGAAQSLLQYLAHGIGHDTEAGLALRDAGANFGAEPDAETKPIDEDTTTETTERSKRTPTTDESNRSASTPNTEAPRTSSSTGRTGTSA